MNVEIWSDIRCPFCYIGKRNFEQALMQFEHQNGIKVIWRSYELDPDLKTDLSSNTINYLAERKGMSKEESKKMHAQVTQMASASGLIYHFDIAKVANSFDAHRFIQYAKTIDLGNKANEVLFKAYFTLGKDISDLNVLLELGDEIGIDSTTLRQILQGNLFSEEVKADQKMAYEIGVSGVPFFVLDNKYAVSGAQAPETFLQALKQAWDEK